MQAPSAQDAQHAAGRLRRWEGHREQRRRELIAAAVKAIRRLGPSVTMDDIAGEAGVAKPVLYRMFRDKAELYRAVGSSVAGEQLIPALIAELSQRREPRAYVQAMIDTYLRLIESEPELYRFVVHPVLDERQVHPDLVRTYKEVIADHVARVIDSVLPGERDTTTLTQSWSRALVGMVHEAGDWWIEQRTMSRAVLAEQLTDLAWGGVSALFGTSEPAG